MKRRPPYLLTLLLGVILLVTTVINTGHHERWDSRPDAIVDLAELRAVSQGTIPLDHPLAGLRPAQPGLAWDYVVRGQGNPDRKEGRKGSRADREDWYRFVRTYPGESIPLGARQAAYEVLLRQTRLNGLGTTSVWQPVGPAPILAQNLGQFPTDSSGRTTAILLHPNDSNTVYVAGAQGGVWKTTNAGTTWTPLTDQQASLAVGAMALDPTNPNVIYVGTGEPHYSADSYYGAGVLKSTDGGATWSQLGGDLFAGLGISSIVVAPSNPNVVYLAVSGKVAGSQSTNTNPGIYTSTDGGANWTAILTFCNASDCASPSSLVMAPTNSAVLYAGFDGVGVWKTTDGGANWTEKLGSNTGLPSLFRRVEVAISPSNAAVLYAGVELPITGGTGGFVFKSTDAGENWVWLNQLQVNYCGGQCAYNHVVAVHPTNPNIVMLGGQALYSGGVPGIDGVIFWTTDGGANWSTNNGSTATSTIHPDLHAIAFDPSNPSTVWIGNDGGVYKTANGGNTWRHVNTNLGTLQFESVALHPTDRDVLFGGMQDNAKAKTTDGGATWVGLDAGDGGFTAIDPFDPNFWYGTRFSISGWVMQFQRNDHNGSAAVNEWPLKSNGIDVNDRVAFYAPFVVDPNVAGRLYWGTNRLYRTNDRGESWAPISGDLTRNINRFSAISNIAVAPSDSNVILVGTADGNVQLTVNGGSTWNNLTKSPLPNRSVSDVAISSGSSQLMYVVYSGFDENTPSTPGHVFKTTDAGATWTNVSNELPNIPVLSIALDRDAPDTIYIGTDLGVYRSTDAGASWTPFNQGLPLVAVFDLALNPDTDLLAAATHGRSIWKMSLTPAETPSESLFLPFVVKGFTKQAPPLPEPISRLSATNDGPTPLGAATTLTATIQSGSQVSYVWDLGDGGLPDNSGPVVSHTYATTGTFTAIVTATNEVSSQSATTTVEVVAAQPLPTVQNGDFEAGPGVGWTELSTNFPTLIVDSSAGFPGGFAPRSGDWVVWLGGANDEAGDLAQTFTIPQGTPVYLHYYYQIYSSDVCGSDLAQILVDETVAAEVDLCASNNVANWTLGVVDMRPYAGQTVTVHFVAEMDSNTVSSLFIDDVSFRPDP